MTEDKKTLIRKACANAIREYIVGCGDYNHPDERFIKYVVTNTIRDMEKEENRNGS